MKRSKRNKSESLAYELLSDLSFSTLGLILIVFVVYAIILNSNIPYRVIAELKNTVEEVKEKNVKLTDENNKVRKKNADLAKENNDIKVKNAELARENTKVKSEKKRVEERLQNAEQAMRRIKQQHLYAGYYAGGYRGKLLYNCSGKRYLIITGNQSISYFPDVNILVRSVNVKRYGTLAFKYKGVLKGNTFTGKPIEYSRGKNIQSCDPDAEIEVKFYDNYLKFEGDFEENTLRRLE